MMQMSKEIDKDLDFNFILPSEAEFDMEGSNSLQRKDSDTPNQSANDGGESNSEKPMTLQEQIAK